MPITNYDQLSFTFLVAAFLAIGASKTFTNYYRSFKKTRKEPKNPRQFEIWLNSYCSFNSVIPYIGFIVETYNYGARLLINMISNSIGYLIGVFIIQPFFYDMKIKTPYEYLEKRYANRISCRVACASAAVVYHLIFSTLFLWGTATVLSTVFPELRLSMSMFVLGIISSTFALCGGLIQKTHINVLQLVIFIFGITAGLVVSMSSFGENFSKYWEIAQMNGRLRFFDTSFDLRTRYTIWNQLIALPIPWCAFNGLLVPNVNRYKQVKTRTRSSFFFISNLPVMFIINTIATLSGILVYMTFMDCDPYLSSKIENKNQIGSYWLLHVLGKKLPSVAGLCLASILVYAIMQHSFGLSLAIQLFLSDVVNPILVKKTGKGLSDTKKKIIKPLLVFLVSMVSILLGMSFQYVRNSVLSLFFMINNSINSPIFGLFILSMVNPYANHVGAVTSFSIVLATNFWLGINSILAPSKSQEFTQSTKACRESDTLRYFNASSSSNSTESYEVNYLYTISAIWYCLYSLLFIVIIGSLISLVYSLIAKGRIDYDKEYSEQRVDYLYSFKKHCFLKHFFKNKLVWV